MDSQYFDLYIKFRNQENEKLWLRGVTMFELQSTLQVMNKINDEDIKHSHKSVIEYIKIE